MTLDTPAFTSRLPTMLVHRAMTERDLPAVLAIERAVHLTPWSEGDFVGSLQGGHDLSVTEIDDHIAGYAVTMRVLDEAHLLTLATAPAQQRRGVGAVTLRAAMNREAAAGALRMFLEVRASNGAARRLYERFGMIEIGRRKGYYGFPDDPSAREDAVIMACDLP